MTNTIKSDTILKTLNQHEQQKEIMDHCLGGLDRGFLCLVHADRRSLLRMEYAIREPRREDSHGVWLRDPRHGSTAWVPDAFRDHADASRTNHPSLLA